MQLYVGGVYGKKFSRSQTCTLVLVSSNLTAPALISATLEYVEYTMDGDEPLAITNDVGL